MPKSVLRAVLGRMQFTLHAIRRAPHGASRLVQAMSAWLLQTRSAPSRHGRDARVYGHTNTAMPKLSTLQALRTPSIAYPVFASTPQVKRQVGKFAPQFSGYGQQDCQVGFATTFFYYERLRVSSFTLRRTKKGSPLSNCVEHPPTTKPTQFDHSSDKYPAGAASSWRQTQTLFLMSEGGGETGGGYITCLLVPS